MEFVDALPPRAGGYDWSRTVETLMENPGQWAWITEAKTPGAACSLAGAIRRGAPTGWWKPAGSFESAVRGLRVYARFMKGDANA